MNTETKPLQNSADYEWDLSPLFSGTDDPKFTEAMEALRRTVRDYNAFAAALDAAAPGATLHRALELEERLTELAMPLFHYVVLRSSVNTQDAEAVSCEGRLQRLMSDTSAANAAVQAYIGRVQDLDAVIDADPFLAEYRFLLHERRQRAKYTLEEKVEEVLAKLDLSGGSAWGNLQAYLTSIVTEDYRGEQRTLTELRSLAYDADPAVRKDAYDAELACYARIKDAVCFALNSLKQQVNTECALRGGESPLAMTLMQSRMKRETLDAMLTALQEYLPTFWKYLRGKAKALGYEGGLKWWDLFAPLGKLESGYTVEQAKDYLLSHFRPFAGDLADMMEQAFSERWIDFFPRPGKVGGAFCMNVPSIRASRILTNFDGGVGEIATLAHELGHAYHGMLIENNRPLNREYTMPVAETASTFNEVVIMDAVLQEADDPQVKLGLLERQLCDVTQIMCDILSRYWFETAVFEKTESGFAFPDELCEMMKTAQLRGYGDGLDPETFNPYMWVCKSHYYSSQLSFYNFPYAFGGLFAAGLYAQYRKEGEAFLPKYRRLLRATADHTVEDTAAVAGIDLTDPDFWRGSLEIYKGKIEEFLTLVDASDK